jgi:hypothetical protein
MTIKRIAVTDGIFTGERLSFDLSALLSADDETLIREALTAMSPSSRIARLEPFIAQCGEDRPAVALRVARIRDTLAAAKAQALPARLALLDAAELWRREIEALPLVEKGAQFSGGKPPRAAGPLRAVVRAILKRKGHADLTARELWAACKALPERQRHGIDFETDDNAFVKRRGNVSFRRFANIVSEEKKHPK